MDEIKQKTKNLQVQSVEINKSAFSKMMKVETAQATETQTLISDDVTNFTGYGQIVGDKEQAKLANKYRKGSIDSRKNVVE